ncbi:hypothetical protein Taro_048052, partial [Colocasia esculenta]|nr:hypothetical protein [Colocasia esculenta]
RQGQSKVKSPASLANKPSRPVEKLKIQTSWLTSHLGQSKSPRLSALCSPRRQRKSTNDTEEEQQISPLHALSRPSRQRKSADSSEEEQFAISLLIGTSSASFSCFVGERAWMVVRGNNLTFLCLLGRPHHLPSPLSVRFFAERSHTTSACSYPSLSSGRWIDQGDLKQEKSPRRRKQMGIAFSLHLWSGEVFGRINAYGNLCQREVVLLHRLLPLQERSQRWIMHRWQGRSKKGDGRMVVGRVNAHFLIVVDYSCSFLCFPQFRLADPLGRLQVGEVLWAVEANRNGLLTTSEIV